MAYSPIYTIVEGPFAAVAGGNATVSYLTEGSDNDIQARARRARGNLPHDVEIYRRNVPGYGVRLDDQEFIDGPYRTREFAERAVSRHREWWAAGRKVSP